MQQLLEVVTAFESAYRSGDSTAAAAAAEFESVLAAALDPLVDMCERSAALLRPSGPSRSPRRPACNQLSMGTALCGAAPTQRPLQVT